MTNLHKYTPSESTRKYLYPIAIAVLALFVGIGWVTEEVSYLVLGVVAAVLGLGTASVNVVDDDKVEAQHLENKQKKEDSAF